MPLTADDFDFQARQRFWAKVQITEGCWLWATYRDRDGYGQHWVNGTYVRAHRFAYALLVAPLPDELTIDHLCHSADQSCTAGPLCPHRGCVNPGHLEPVTRLVNWSRGRNHGRPARDHDPTSPPSSCKYGHPLDDKNLYISRNGAWNCRICNAAAGRRYYAKHKEGAQP